MSCYSCSILSPIPSHANPRTFPGRSCPSVSPRAIHPLKILDPISHSSGQRPAAPYYSRSQGTMRSVDKFRLLHPCQALCARNTMPIAYYTRTKNPSPICFRLCIGRVGRAGLASDGDGRASLSAAVREDLCRRTDRRRSVMGWKRRCVCRGAVGHGLFADGGV
jgi:hypothetical protein